MTITTTENEILALGIENARLGRALSSEDRHAAFLAAEGYKASIMAIESGSSPDAEAQLPILRQLAHLFSIMADANIGISAKEVRHLIAARSALREIQEETLMTESLLAWA